jgi:hypothetical protein
MARYKKISALAEELELDTDKAIKLLEDKRVPVFEGWYDAPLWEAVAQEKYVAGKKRLATGLSARLGVGAVQALLDPFDIAVTVHDPRGAQWLMLCHGAQRQYVKWHYSNDQQIRKESCIFHVSNFLLPEKAAAHYLLTCFTGPVAWVVTPAMLGRAWRDLTSGKTLSHATIPEGQSEHPGGVLVLRMSTTNSPHLLRDKKQLGF